ncbi:MAG: GAF domain-containing protein [Muribaculaceae bacterium]|nr:GAF domain-containing protein [Muribaculaceae bacterium]
MAEELITGGSTKEERYRILLPQLASIIEDEPDPVANMANIAAAIHCSFDFLWTGFYRVDGDTLVLGPFQGPLACTRIKFGRGVCGTAWSTRRTIVVDDVEKFPGHIACSSASRSEIVVPIFKDGIITGVLDIDSTTTSTFDDTDARYLEEAMAILSHKL